MSAVIQMTDPVSDPGMQLYDEATDILDGAWALASLMADLMAAGKSDEPSIQVGREELHTFLFDMAARIDKARKLLSASSQA